MKAGDKPIPGGDGATRCEPQLGIEREKPITGGEVGQERKIGITRPGVTLDDDGVAFKGDVTLVGGKEEGEEIVVNSNRAD
jgi:hypothetical protein